MTRLEFGDVFISEPLIVNQRSSPVADPPIY